MVGDLSLVRFSIPSVPVRRSSPMLFRNGCLSVGGCSAHSCPSSGGCPPRPPFRGLRSGTPLSGLSFPRLRHPNNQRLPGTPFRHPTNRGLPGAPFRHPNNRGLSGTPFRHPNNRGLSGAPFRRRGPLPLTRPRTAMPPASPGLQPIRRRVLRLPDASLSPSAGSRRFQNDSCGQFACAVCHEMKKQPCLFILWHDFSQFCPKHGHEMNNCCGYFILCSKSWGNEGGQFSSPLLFCPFALDLNYARSLIRLPVKRHLT